MKNFLHFSSTVWWISLDFGLLETVKDITLGFRKLWWTLLVIFLTFYKVIRPNWLIEKTICLIDNENYSLQLFYTSMQHQHNPYSTVSKLKNPSPSLYPTHLWFWIVPGLFWVIVTFKWFCYLAPILSVFQFQYKPIQYLYLIQGLVLK